MSESNPRPDWPAPVAGDRPAEHGRTSAAVAAAAPRGDRITRGAGVILAIICVVVAGIAVRFTDELQFAVVKTVPVGETTSLNGGRVTVTEVEVGKFLEVGSYEPERIESKGVFLVATVRLEAPREEERIGGLGDLKLYAGDRTYSSFGMNTTVVVPAGYVGTARVMFEVDPVHIADAYIELARFEMVWQVPQKVHVPLGITDRNADAWVKAARGRAVDGNQDTVLKALS